MTQLNLNLPIIGDANATEDPKIRTALSDIETVVNSLDNANISSTADINGSKLLNQSIATEKLVDSAITTAKINNDAVTTAKIANGAVTQDKFATPTSASGTGPGFGYTTSITAKKFVGGLVVCQGSSVNNISVAQPGDLWGTLPAGYRPAASVIFTVAASGGNSSGSTNVIVDTDGTIKTASGGKTASTIYTAFTFAT